MADAHGHPTDEAWERLACGEMSRTEAAVVVAHARDCSACLRTYRALATLHAEADAFDPGVPRAAFFPRDDAFAPSPRGRVGGPWWHRPAALPWAAAFAASAVAVALLYPAYLGVAQLRAPRSGSTPAGASVPPVRLEAWRGPNTGRSAVVPIAPDQAFAVLLVEPAIPAGLVDDQRLRFEVRAAAGDVSWSGDATAGEIRRALASPAEAIAVVVPVATLASGSHALVLRDASGGELFDVPFEAVREPGAVQPPLERKAPQ